MSPASLWGQFLTAYRTAQVARDAMRDKASPQTHRDQATQVLVIQSNRMMDMLETMSERQILIQIGTLLNGRGR